MDHLALPGVLTSRLEHLINWSRKSSLWYMLFGLACCAMEMMATGASRYDLDRFGMIFRASPRQSDLMIVAGTVNEKMGPIIKRLWDEMAEPKWVIAMGACASNGGPYHEGYNVVNGVNKFIPVDVYIAGCPPRPEALLFGVLQLQDRIRQGEPPAYVAARQKVQVETIANDTNGRPSGTDGHALNPKLEELGSPAPTAIDFATEDRERKQNTHEAETKDRDYGRRPSLDGAALDGSGRMMGEVDEFVRAAIHRFPSATGRLHDGWRRFTVPPEQWRSFARWLMEEKGLNYLSSLTAVHWPDEHRMDVVMHGFRVQSGEAIKDRIEVTTRIPDDHEAYLPSLAHIWPTADWHEREAMDMFGIRFDGHPNPKRLLLREGFDGHPLRKDYNDPKQNLPVAAATAEP